MTDYSIFSSDFKNSKGRMFLENIKTDFWLDLKINDIPQTAKSAIDRVKDIKKYVERPPGAGNIFTTLKTGAPVNVKAAVRYNDFLKFD